MGKKLIVSKRTEISPEGDPIMCVGKYVQGIALQAFNDLGGQKKFNEWASENYGDFATKFLTKMLPRAEVAQQKTEKTVEDILEEIEGEMIDVTPVESEEEDE